MVSSNSIILGCEIVILLCILFIYSSIELDTIINDKCPGDDKEYCNALRGVEFIGAVSLILLANDIYNRFYAHGESENDAYSISNTYKESEIVV